MMHLLFFLLVGCGSDVTLTPGQDGCTNYNFDEPSQSDVAFEVSADGTGSVWRTFAVQDQAGLLFDPEISVSGDVVAVYEAWSGGESDDAFCYQPYVGFTGLAGSMTVEWYLEVGDAVPWETVEISTDG